MTIEHEQDYNPKNDYLQGREKDSGDIQSTKIELHEMRPNGLPKRMLGDRLQRFLEVKTSVHKTFSTEQTDSQ